MGESPNAINESGPTFWERPHPYPQGAPFVKHETTLIITLWSLIITLIVRRSPSEEGVVIYSRTDLTLSLNAPQKFTCVLGRAHSKRQNLISEKCQGLLLPLTRRALSFAVTKYFVCVSMFFGRSLPFFRMDLPCFFQPCR